MTIELERLSGEVIRLELAGGDRQQRELVCRRLRDQQAIERITVDPRQGRDANQVRRAIRLDMATMALRQFDKRRV